METHPPSMPRGFEAERLLRQARDRVAGRIGCAPEEVLFTSGGTEANNLAVFGAAQALARRGHRIVTTAIEHPSVEKPMRELERQGFEVIFLPAGEDGKVRREDLFEAVNSDTILVSMMAVNNEVGSLQPLDAVRGAIKRAGAPALFHCDCVQGFGKLEVKPAALGIDLMTVSSHKIHGPKGAGALYIRRGVRVKPRVFGGGQEKDLRPGTGGNACACRLWGGLCGAAGGEGGPCACHGASGIFAGADRRSARYHAEFPTGCAALYR